MSHRMLPGLACALVLASAPALSAPVVVSGDKPDVIATWYDVGVATINQPAAPSGTAEERLPVLATDMATMHLAMYDAVAAIAGTHQPFAAKPTTPTAGASVDAAAAAAAYSILQALFPSRSATYKQAYADSLARIADGDAKDRGIAIGNEVAAQIVAQRADDGRSTPSQKYAPGSGPGQFRGASPVFMYMPHMKPMALTSAGQFRAPAAPPLDSAQYAKDVNETKALGGAVSAARTAQQLEIARFHTEPPPTFQARNFRKFAASGSSVAQNARLAALVWTVISDAQIACFESKYVYNFWRPLSAIPLADTDGNPATEPDPEWKPVVPTPNHPEYPAAHGCVLGALAQALKRYYGTGDVQWTMDSSVTGTTHTFRDTDEIRSEVVVARIAGGMHFRTSVEQGEALGAKVADWVADQRFPAKE
jgi:hypothetical protein